MKYKKILIISAVLFVLAGICFLGALALAGFDFSRLSGAEYTEKSATFESIHSIVIDDDNGNIKIARGNTDHITVTYHDSNRAVYDITEDNGRLTVTKKPISWLYYFLNFDFADRTLTVTLPDGDYKELYADTDNGSVTVENAAFEKAAIRTSNGGIYLNDSTLLRLDASTSNGTVRLNRVISDGAFADTSNGKIVLDDVKAEKCTMSTSNGKIEARNITSADCRLYTSNASVDLVINGDPAEYTVTHSTSNGKSTVPATGSGPNLVDIATSNGSIYVEFTE